ncbi:MAG: DUF3488 domain-containing protein [Deltaproteobacteria bacterium]|nr:DUF3488 domain-containing protein [Deltaproteobacteria bacterium]
MTLYAGHELATALATTAALLAVLTGGQMNPVAWGALLAVPLGAWLQSRKRGLSTRAGGVLALAAVAWGMVFTLGQGLNAILLGAGYALCLLVVVRLLNRETPAHDLQLYALSLLLVLDAAALNINWVYAPCFLAYTVAIVWALTTRELKRAAMDDHRARAGTGAGEAPLWREPGVLRGRFFAATAVIAVAVLLATLSLFIVFPRVGLGMLRLAGGRTSGFATSVRLGGQGLISPDNSVVMRVTEVDGDEPLPLTLYFRGSAFDRYDGVGWVRSEELARGLGAAHARMPRASGPTRRYRVALEPLSVPYLFTAGNVGRVSVVPGPRLLAAPAVPFRDGLGDLVLASSPDELTTYEVEASLDLSLDPARVDEAEPFPPVVRERFLDTSLLGERATALARRWTAEATTPWARVNAIRERLSDYAYTVEDEPPPPGVSPLDHFLFTRRAGHCEYYATALAMLSRAVGVPARMVGGYQGGAGHPQGYTVLRQSDAHAWAEVWLPGLGWWQVDATPRNILNRPPLSWTARLAESLQQAWEEYVVDFGLTNQVTAAQGVAAALSRLRTWRPPAPGELLRPGLVAALLLGALALSVWLWRRGGALRGAHPTRRLRSALHDAVVRVTGHAPPTATVREWVSSAAVAVADEDRVLLERARDVFEAARYGSRALPPEMEAVLCRKLGQVRLPPGPEVASTE